jgi:hypothetical protein
LQTLSRSSEFNSLRQAIERQFVALNAAAGQPFSGGQSRSSAQRSRCAPATPSKRQELTMIEQSIVMTIVCVLGVLIAMGAAVALGAMILRAAAKWAEKIDLPFWSAAGTVLLSTLASYAIAFVLGLIFGTAAENSDHRVAHGLVAPLGFFAQSAIISGRHQLSFGKGIKISIFMWLVCVLIGIAVALVVAGILLVMPRFS